MKIVLIAFVLLTSFACKKLIVPPGTPACIKSEIVKHKNNAIGAIGQVDEYEFQGKIVYAFEPDGSIIADGSTKVVYDNCDLVCYFGGFGGPDIIKCNGLNFYQNAKFIRNIWKKN